MIPFLSCTGLAALFTVLLSVVSRVEGHGYMKSPKSRNYENWENGNENCPHCLNRGGTLAECGISGGNNYDLIPTGPQWTYSKGDIVEFDVVLTAHHKGHFEFSACPIQEGGTPTAACFDSYPLEFVSDELYGGTKDPNYPERAYIAPISYPGLLGASSAAGMTGSFYRFRFKLPDDLVGDLVLLQWHYLTANSCEFAGYDTYAFPADWNAQTGVLGICSNIPPDGNGVPEQFWNCAEVSIVDGPTPAATSAPSPAPGSPVPGYSTPTYPGGGNGPYTGNGGGGEPDGKCGNGFVNDATCPNPTDCCSRWGWCGTSSAHCDNPGTATPVADAGPTDAPSGSPSVAPVTTTAPVVVPTSAPVPPAPATVPTDAPVDAVTPAPVGSPAPVTSPPVDSSQWTLSAVSHRCGRGSNPEVDARGNCRMPCLNPSDCASEETCVGVQLNYCDSKPATQCDSYDSPSTSNRCGTSEIDARGKCGKPCTGYFDCESTGEWCFAVHPNFCDCSSRRNLRHRASE